MQKQITYLISMGLLAGLFSLFGCGQTKNSNTKTNAVDTGSIAFYPKDHKLTGQERKDFSNRFLKQKGVPTLDHLPLVEDFTEAKFRDRNEVAKKAVVLYGLIYVGHGEKRSEEIITYFKKYNLWNTVSPDERQYLEKENKTGEDNNLITWRIENLNVLLWALDNFDTLSFPTTMCDFGNYRNLPNLDTDPTEWIAKSKLRDTEDILNETDLIYRIHWATTEARLKGRKMPAVLSEDIVMERHFALNWLTMYADDWDDITTDT
ncbi:DUF4272 domain-containing protein [Flavihumibacter petaseus]|uniref:DUF4272 domain-containing protein n=1 Tax=Flavihumibacter petaseus NBRC 106054 TaxID=1220578 RepID=A0A0E9N0G2_9BACT|nr:DUF4272 domain-containing protein [Flavihumibacter petaseus]GAO43339.1 hypothetical protein FPE01S_02_04440 [Flavihumibacter petaseus NBRC 106054]